MERTKKELDNVIKSINSQRERLPEYSFFGDNNWEKLEEEIRYVEHYIKNGYLPDFDEDIDAYDCYEWLNGEDNEYYIDCMEEID